MPGWRGDSTGKLELFFVNPEDMEKHIKEVVIPLAGNLGFEVTYKKKGGTPEQPKVELLLETARV